LIAVPLLELPLRAGGSVVVDVDEGQRGPVTRGGRREEIVIEAGQTFEDAIDRVTPAFRALVERLRDLAERPDEIEVNFGLSLSADFGAIVAKTGGQANFSVSLKWSRQEGSHAGV